MKMSELLKMRSVSWLVQVKHNQDETGSVIVAADTACCLDLFSGRFWLSLNDHQTKSQDIETH